MRKNGARFSLGILTVAVLLLAAPALQASDGEFTSVSGKVEYRLPGGSWQDAEVGAGVPQGTRVSTGFNSEAKIEIESAVLQVKSLTRMSIEELVKKEGLMSTDLQLEVGRIRADVKSTEGLENEFKVRSPLSTAAVKGTSFEFDCVNIRVFGGKVNFTNRYNVGGNVSGGESGSAEGGSPSTGPGRRERNVMVSLSTLPGFVSDGDSGEVFSGFSSYEGVEYGSIGGTVSFD